LDAVSFPTIGHVLEHGFVDPEISAQVPGVHVVGRAVTVRMTAPDSTLVHVAAGLLEPGDALVIDMGQNRRQASVGELVALACKEAGASAVVVDGYCTDIHEIRAMRMPVFARGTTLLTTKIHGLRYGAINERITCGGVPVEPGDVVCADDNGVLILPPVVLMGVLDRVEQSDAAEPALKDALRAGGKLPDLTGAGKLYGGAGAS
jgi:regulator of RNase E activity RraA